MPAAPPQPETGSSLLARVGFGAGVAVGRTVEVVTYPGRLLGRLLRRGRRDPPERGGAELREARLSGFVQARRAATAGGSEAARIAADEGLSALAEALSAPAAEDRMRALDVVCELSGERAGRLLTGVLHDPDPSLRSAAARAVAQLGASGAVFSLILTLEDESEEVRRAAAHAIEDVTGKHVPLGSDGHPTAHAVEDLKRWWKERRFVQLSSSGLIGRRP